MRKLSIKKKTVQKCEKALKNSKILKNDGHFLNPNPQISLKQYANICKIIIYLIWLWSGGEDDFRKIIPFFI